MLSRQRSKRQRLMNNRLALLACVITVIIGIYIVRLGWLQLLFVHSKVEDSTYTVMQRTVIQRARALVLDDGRGTIVDREGRPYTGQPVTALVLFPVNKNTISTDAVRSLALWLHLPEQEVSRRWEKLAEPLIWPNEKDDKLPFELTADQAAQIQSSDWEGVSALPYTIRYPLRQHTPQWVGAIADLAGSANTTTSKRKGINAASSVVGISGLERSFGPLLKGLGATTAVHYTDAGRHPLNGLHVRIRRPDNPYYPLRLTTTTDQMIEAAIEQVLDRFKVAKGSVVVLDAATRDVVAMVSRPSADPYHIEPEQGSWNNRAIKALPPGSVYKLFIAAAAMEAGLTQLNERFQCDGHYGKYGLACWLPEGHGMLTLREALAESCNEVFAELGERLSGEQLASYAQRMGVSGLVGMISDDGMGHRNLHHFEGEEESRVFPDGVQPLDVSGGVRAQSGIGQRDVRITPLAAANFVVTLLQDGNYGSPRLIQEVQYATGMPLARFAVQAKKERIMKLETARSVQKMMVDVVQYGTGQSLRQVSWNVAGKSGTAQAEAYGTANVHTWFVGYGPVEKPRYAVSVVSENDPASASHKATEVFGAVMEILAQHAQK
ncbi:peptidoglycan D,D-transpeptidase FtsI family protein [Paenibacillus alvei]|uniref:peptidoglycan D,D-transpeptidase FtsI family protein n=1 Tax=Paenibacillus alvei TaxID=44250 RepID=UPI0018CDAF45|nr:penicillin-binding transpeptidase domain-containing protein [Paenibacillus alvei]MCY9579036.1 penicillin-binding transpeptidase domain-containing protein [Paenibacillus alvei]MCY9583464.1 penicillin-binding transpeptidase domain-containing protein [Paenibacillus alvei]